MEATLQKQGTETENKRVETASLREALKTGSIKEWADGINDYVRSSSEQNELTEDKCRGLLLLIYELTDRTDLSHEDQEYLRKMEIGLMNDIPLYTCASALNVLAIQMNREGFDKDLLSRTVCLLRKRGYSYKEIKKSVNKSLTVEGRIKFGKFLSEIKDSVDTYLALDKETDRVAKAFDDLGNDPWTEQEALTEAIGGMSWATEMLLREHHLDSTVYLAKKGVRIIYPLIFNNEKEKSKSIQVLQMLVRKTQPDAVITFAENWVGGERSKLRPSEDPQRKEAITVSVETPLGFWHGFQYFTRDDSGEVVLGTLIAPEKTEAEGRFIFMNHEVDEKVQCNA